LLSDEWPIAPTQWRDLGGSANLNLLVDDRSGRFVARVYRPFVTPARLDGLQRVRRALSAHGLPVVAPVPTRAGRPWSWLEDRLVEVEPFVPSTGRMNSVARLETALPTLGRMHAVMADPRLATDGPDALFANYGRPLTW